VYEIQWAGHFMGVASDEQDKHTLPAKAIRAILIKAMVFSFAAGTALMGPVRCKKLTDSIP
jgi:hypothetical protein